MHRNDPTPQRPDPASVIVGYLNFSSGAFDPAAWRAMNDLYAEIEPAAAGVVCERPDAAVLVARMLGDRLARLEATQAAFRDAHQARRMLAMLFDELLPAYRQYHADLLEHQPPGAIERPFFVMAAATALLAEAAAVDPSADDTSQLVARSIDRLNDYVGWRPVAVLENGRLSAPYPH